MNRGKQEVLLIALLLGAVLWFTFGLKSEVWGEERFPERPISIIVPAAPGGGTDINARVIADAAEPFLKQKVVVVNKPGGSGTIGMDAIVKAKADGYTLGCLWNAPLSMVPHTLKVDYTLDQFSFVTQLVKGVWLFCVRSEFPAQNGKEFFEYARKNPGKLTYANDGVGNSVQFTGERVFHAMKVKLRPVPYSGAGESIKALLGGQVDVYGGSTSPAIPHVKSGAVRGIFVTSRDRIEELPEVMGVSELGCPEAETLSWRCIVGPKGIPADRLAILEKAFRQAGVTEKVKSQMKKLGETAVASSSKDCEGLVRSEFSALAIVAKELGLTPK